MWKDLVMSVKIVIVTNLIVHSFGKKNLCRRLSRYCINYGQDAVSGKYQLVALFINKMEKITFQRF